MREPRRDDFLDDEGGAPYSGGWRRTAVIVMVVVFVAPIILSVAVQAVQFFTR